MFAVDDIEDVVARLRTHGAELVGDLAQYEDVDRLCYVRGPDPATHESIGTRSCDLRHLPMLPSGSG